ncbi:MAG: acetylglutamate kinase [Firmicutes bacterium]|nr:acetylglutamate kinase [Bacillota bacterium]
MASFPEKTGFLWLNNTMRMLWEQHAAWTRMTIISIVEDLADVEPVTRRLLRNPGDFAAVFRRFYGKQTADRVETLFTEHLVLAAELVQAAKAGDVEAAQEAERRWYANGDEIAAFLSRINPFWNRQEMERLWRVHLDQVRDQALARLNGDYEEDIFFYDQGEKHVLKMADEFTRGIARQFRSSS